MLVRRKYRFALTRDMAWKRFPHYWPFVRGIHWSPVSFHHKKQAIQSFDVYREKLLDKQQSWRCSETRWWSCDVTAMIISTAHVVMISHTCIQLTSFNVRGKWGLVLTTSIYIYIHYDDVIMSTIASQITSLTSVYSTDYSDADQRKHQSSASLAFVWGIHRDRWIPRTKGQWRGKCFRLMTSSWKSQVWVTNRQSRSGGHRPETVLNQSPFSVCALQWHHNGRDCISNHQPRDCLLNRLFRRRSKKTSKLRVTGLCAGNSPGTGEFPAQMASNAENVFIQWRHHVRKIACEQKMLHM